MTISTINWLKGQDVQMLSDIVEAEGWTPVGLEAIAVVATDEQGIAGFNILQRINHVGPWWVRPDMRGTKLSGELIIEMKRFLDAAGVGYLVIADTPEAVHLCEAFKMRRVESPVYIL